MTASDDGFDRPFNWGLARRWLDGLPGDRGLNIAYEAVDRHVARGHGQRSALRLLPKNAAPHVVTYAELAEATNRFANAFEHLGGRPGDRVFVLLTRGAALYTAVLGALKARAVVCPLFPAFGPEPIAQRMAIGEARFLVTDSDQYVRKVAGARGRFPQLQHVLLTGDGRLPGTASLDEALAAAAPSYAITPTDPDDPAILHFTSGTTGTPKGALHVHGAVVAHHATGRLVLGLTDGDVYWCTADPGWVTGTSYGVIAPLTCGVTSVVDEADFDAGRWYRVLAEQRVNVWYTSPTAIRMLMRAGPEAIAGADLSSVRFAASVGEPLGADAVAWGEEVLGFPFNDNWWQTETGGIMVANRPGIPIRPGSMGQPIPGIEVEVFACDDEGEVRTTPSGCPLGVSGPDESGMLAIRAPWPSMFRAYLGQPERYERSFLAGWYLTGDLVRRDADGYLWFVSRADDVIKTSGHLIGPFEVESVLRAHPAVADAGVYGVPDPVAGALVHAAVVVAPGHEPSSETIRSVLGHGRRCLGAAVAPRRIVVVDALPKTRSGKVMRRLLRARELGLAEGDLSTLEPSHA